MVMEMVRLRAVQKDVRRALHWGARRAHRSVTAKVTPTVPQWDLGLAVELATWSVTHWAPRSALMSGTPKALSKDRT